MTPEQLMEIPGIGEKMVDKIYQAVNRFYEGGEAAATPVETTDENGEETPAAEASAAETSGEAAAETASETETSAATASASETNSEAAASTESETPAEQQEEKSS
jgi:Holliday junction resolvasome RuvABC DNA-binding subunit